MVNVARLDPAGTVTVAGGCADGLLLASEITVLEEAAAESVTVPRAGKEPGAVAGVIASLATVSRRRARLSRRLGWPSSDSRLALRQSCESRRSRRW